MRYQPNLGIMGNLKRVISRETDTNTQVVHHKEEYAVDHIQMEQQHTDSFLNNIEAQQQITDLMLEIEELKRRN